MVTKSYKAEYEFSTGNALLPVAGRGRGVPRLWYHGWQLSYLGDVRPHGRIRMALDLHYKENIVSKKNLPPIEDSPIFQDILKELRERTPDSIERLKDYLDKNYKETEEDEE